ncbi:MULTISPECIES: hypothetical protein [Bacillota]|uniref:hypothetical protein n=1 Tax=Bacillota TaxID=1239 RepID=UPI0039EE404C
MNLIDIIQDEMLSDDECTEKRTANLIQQYENATQSEKTVINELFITLTGWSYESLVEKCKG